MSLPAVSKHLKVLERAGLITRGREAQWRPCRIEPQALKDIDDWLERLPQILRREFRPPRRLLETLQAKEPRTDQEGRAMAATNSIDLERIARSIIGIARIRRAARTRLLGMDRSEAPGAMVGSRTASPPRPRAVSTFVPGGVWRFVMHGPDGRDYQNRITFEEIVPPERIVYRHGGGEDVEPVQFGRRSFSKISAARTRIIWRGDFPSAAERDRVIKEYGADKGLAQTMARLADFWRRRTSRRRAQRVFSYWGLSERRVVVRPRGRDGGEDPCSMHS